MYKNNSGFSAKTQSEYLCTKFSAKLKGKSLEVRYHSYTKPLGNIYWNE